MSKEIPERVGQRAFDRWTLGENGCHISTYSVQSRGYAQIGWRDEKGNHGTTAHRAAWVHVHGQVADGFDVDHCNPEHCDKRCVNVDHLRLLTVAQNRRQEGRGFPLGFCKRGHPNSGRVQNHRGAWICPTCKRDQTRESYLRCQARKAAA
ncbi:HNH endonuclease signature motif containing protein [Mycolicibacterium fluoranthenivorans]|uniref:HNH nuclease domain-containing protein n=1 Tax=Mycolicibacterium fluoranthenivorans TaxID=258505 RepID=A0A7X5U414_9MYCO|nr:HNH endonuclease signature motif containing protein [Mycolicibacterium fluoranthenivorans]MCV7358473.1 HNH endonuclease [Mycolicibacterium fluoranthenivorans]NIH98049.1 hypothetical protein [Mycolicibacterium fluoranthenivorans]